MQDRKTIDGLIRRLEDSFNQHDANGWTAQFAPDAVTIDPFGRLLDGSDALREHSVFLFEGPMKSAQTTYQVDRVRELGDGHVLVNVSNAIRGVSAPGAPEVIRGRFSLACERKGDDWQIVGMQGTQVQPLPTA